MKGTFLIACWAVCFACWAIDFVDGLAGWVDCVDVGGLTSG